MPIPKFNGHGRTDALKRLLLEDGAGNSPPFWTRALSALYPAVPEEKRWMDGLPALKKSWGF